MFTKVPRHESATHSRARVHGCEPWVARRPQHSPGRAPERDQLPQRRRLEKGRRRHGAQSDMNGKRRAMRARWRRADQDLLPAPDAVPNLAGAPSPSHSKSEPTDGGTTRSARGRQGTPGIGGPRQSRSARLQSGARLRRTRNKAQPAKPARHHNPEDAWGERTFHGARGERLWSRSDKKYSKRARTVVYSKDIPSGVGRLPEVESKGGRVPPPREVASIA